MLEGKIKIGQDTAVRRAEVQEKRGKVVGVYIEEPDPEPPFQSGNSVQQFREGRFRSVRAQVSAIGPQVLTDKAEFTDAAFQ
jgi:hypothetical protein